MTDFLTADDTTVGTFLRSQVKFRVPAYQRDYAWTEDQVDELWEDIQAVVNGDREHHFLGAITTKSIGGEEVELIDGQQRLCTLMMLLSALKKGVESRGDSTRAAMLHSYLGWQDPEDLSNSTWRLTLNATNNADFKDLVLGDGDQEIEERLKKKSTTESNRKLLSAYLRLKALVSDVYPSSDALQTFAARLLKFLPTKFSIIVISVSEAADAYLIFETLNARGLDLSTADLMKNFFLSKAEGTKDGVKDCQMMWDEMLGGLGRVAPTTYIRHYHLSHFGVVREKELFKTISKKYAAPKEAYGFLRSLKTAADFYGALYDPTNELHQLKNAKLTSEMRDALEALVAYRTNQSYPVLLAAIEVLPPEKYVPLASIVARFVFRYSIVCQKGTGNLERNFSEVAKRLRQSGKEKGEVEIEQLLRPVFDMNPTQEEFKKDFREKVFRSDALSRYVLAKINDHLTQVGGLSTSRDTALLTLEHIMPKKIGEAWRDAFPENFMAEDYVGRLGNMTLLPPGQNSKGSNHSFNRKRDNVFSVDPLEITKPLVAVENWGPDEIEERQRWLADVAGEIWSLGPTLS